MISNYNGFPTYDLAEKSVNLSKLGRLILLWQYANDCVCEHDLGDINQPKFRVINASLNLRDAKIYKIAN